MPDYQPYVEDYDSVISEAIPSTARRGHPSRQKSHLAEVATAEYEGVSDSGYSSLPTESTPPLPRSTPAPQREPSRNASNPIPRPSSKAYQRTASPAVPRNIPGAKPRTTSSSGGADECDCPDCKTTAKPSPGSPSILSGAWPVHHSSGSYHSPYGHSPHAYSPYQYPVYTHGPPTDSGVTDTSSKRSMPPPSRPQSTFGGSTTSSSWTHGGSYGGSYFGQVPHSIPSPAPPAPSTTCPPMYSSVYAPPPVPSPVPNSPYGAPGYASYGPDYWGRSGTPSTPSSTYPVSDYSSIPTAPPSNRRNSMRSRTPATGLHETTEEYSHPPRRPSARVQSGERPLSWQHQAQYADSPNRSVSVPPTEHSMPESSRRRMTPQPMRRRESGASQSSSGLHSSRLPPSALSRAMESCAIDDDPPPPSRSQSRSQYDSHGALARREAGTMMHPSRSNQGSDSGSSRSGSSQYESSREEMVQLTIPDADESFTMSYPAGIPVKLQLNAYQYIQQNVEQRQRQVHAQLRYGAGQLDHRDRRTNGEYATATRMSGYARRESMNAY